MTADAALAIARHCVTSRRAGSSRSMVVLGIPPIIGVDRRQWPPASGEPGPHPGHVDLQRLMLRGLLECGSDRLGGRRVRLTRQFFRNRVDVVVGELTRQERE